MDKNVFIYDFENLLDTKIGAGNGVSKDSIDNLKKDCEKIYDNIFVNANDNTKAILDTIQNNNLNEIKKMASFVRNNCENFVVFGIGGSSLGGEAIFDALCYKNFNSLPDKKRNAPRFYIEDNVDPDELQILFDNLDLNKTIFCIISKSGKTTETLSQFFLAKDLCEKKFKDDWKKHFVILTDDNQNYLNKFATENNLPKIFIPTELGGRFSVLSAVGLLPACVLGLNIDKIIDGAKTMLQCVKQKDVWQNASMLSACFNYLNYQKGKNMSVVIPYCSKLNTFNDWYCQLWGESIGKVKNSLNNVEHIGQTPIRVSGPCAQHSQFQLYLDGPDDKIFTFVGVQKFDTQINLPKDFNVLFGQDVASNRTFGDLMNIERIASTSALTAFNKPNETILLSEINEFTLGKLFVFFIFKLLFMAELLKVNPYGQPAVESIKLAVASILKSNNEKYTQNKIEI